MSRVQGNGGTMTERAWRFTQGKGGNYSRPASKSLLPSGRTKLGVESSRSVSLIRNLTYLTKSFELGGRGGGSKL